MPSKSKDPSYIKRQFARYFGCNYVPKKMRTGGWPEYDHPAWFITKIEDEEIFEQINKAHRRARFRQRTQSQYKDKRAPLVHVRPHTHFGFDNGFVVMRARDFREFFVGDGGNIDQMMEIDYLGWTRSTWDL